jgi:adenine specific DNA methylase Mod
MNTLYYGDNLDILRDKITSESVDLIYLDPPFQSGKNYNIIFQPELNKIKGATAQIKTFEDTWQWGEEVEREYQGLITGTIIKEKPSQKLIEFVKAMRSFLTECSLMAYLSMMAPRLVEMRRVLSDTGSIYLHCDPTASHYLKLLMDAVFEPVNFRNEITWKRTSAHSDPKRYGANVDILLFYSKSNQWTWNQLYRPHDPEYIARFRHKDENGRLWTDDNLTAKGLSGGGYEYEYKGVKSLWRCPKETMEKLDSEGRLHFTTKGGIRLKRYLSDTKGVVLQCLWDDIPPINSQAQERLGYPTQKPEALLERIIKSSSNEGDLVLDPFCGCGTAVAVSQSLNRKWIGIDITYLAIDVIKKRLEKNRIREGVDFEIGGEPTDVYSAEKLAEKDPFQFQIWCVSKLDATPTEMKTGDQGVDGIINFIDLTKKDKAGKGIIQVKGTQTVTPEMVRSLKGTVKSQDADFGILITLKKATHGMVMEAVKNGYAESTKKLPKIQLLTTEDLFKKPIPIILPGQILQPYKKPEIKKEQKELF